MINHEDEEITYSGKVIMWLIVSSNAIVHHLRGEGRRGGEGRGGRGGEEGRGGKEGEWLCRSFLDKCLSYL